MFEAGIALKKQYGADNVYDFSLGNPDLPPPPTVKQAILEVAEAADKPLTFGYMPNAGYPQTRAALAEKISGEQGVEVSANHVIAACGAAGGINIFFRAVLTPGDEVICPAPYFVEYGFYAANFGGKLKPVQTREDFHLDLCAMKAAINEKTRAIIINSPNNPTGQIYTREELSQLAGILKEASARYHRVIYLISDEPYRFLNFDHLEIPSVFSLYDASVVIGSFSKNLCLAGERVGYVAVSPSLEGGETLVAALAMTNRILGFLNAPTVAQSIINKCVHSQVDVEIYRRRREMVAKLLTDAGISFVLPHGTFYFFPKSPTEDETIFIDALVKERVLVVPGRGFGLPGYFRLAFCVSDDTIRNSVEGFKRAADAVRGA